MTKVTVIKEKKDTRFIKNKFGIDEEFFKISRIGSNVTNFIDLSTANRKKYISTFLPNIDSYLSAYNTVSDKFKILKKEIDEYLKNTTVEGMYTLQSIYKLIHNKRIKMPIINLIKDIIEGKKEKEELLKFLITK